VECTQINTLSTSSPYLEPYTSTRQEVEREKKGSVSRSSECVEFIYRSNLSQAFESSIVVNGSVMDKHFWEAKIVETTRDLVGTRDTIAYRAYVCAYLQCFAGQLGRPV